eukprot:13544686-Ditylum_brightwellii.AAC.1
MEPVSQTHGTKPNDEYEDQFIWDAGAQEPNDSFNDKLDTETPDGAGEKWKALDPVLTPSKVRRNAVQLNTQAGNEEKNSNKGLMKERGKRALDTKAGYQTAVKIKW